jgi:hypothetical protein
VAIQELVTSVGIGSFSGETMRGTIIGVSQDERNPGTDISISYSFLDNY